MRSARSIILERVRRAATTGRIPRDWMQVQDSKPSRTLDRVALRDKFVGELTSLGVASYVAASASEVRTRVKQVVGSRSVFSWDAGQLPYDVASVLVDPANAASPHDVQALAEVGVTGCQAAIAETGSVVVLSGSGTPRAASLLPPTHVCVVRIGDLYWSIGDFFQARSADIAAAACCTFITGPSRTADIELTLTLGVHGPGEVIVIVGP
jgi:L-lactate dehydrogenase complex protein LldG